MKEFKSRGEYEDEKIFHKEISNKCKIGIVELGVLHGDTTKILLDNSDVIVYGIDPIIPDSMNKDLIGDINKIKNLEKNERFIFIKDFSYNVIKDWNNKFDYLFIDADHRYEYVKQDFEDWFPFLSKGGVVALHDSAANRGGPFFWDGPSQLSDELLNDDRVEYLDTIFTLTAFRKK